MQIRKTYYGVDPELLYTEVKDFVLKHGVSIGQSKMETSAMPGDSSSFIIRGTMTFSAKGSDKECLRVHIVGSVKTDTKLMLDVDDSCFPQDKVAALQGDIDFIFGGYETRPEP